MELSTQVAKATLDALATLSFAIGPEGTLVSAAFTLVSGLIDLPSGTSVKLAQLAKAVNDLHLEADLENARLEFKNICQWVETAKTNIEVLESSGPQSVSS